jgi:hypothetical protein
LVGFYLRGADLTDRRNANRVHVCTSGNIDCANLTVGGNANNVKNLVGLDGNGSRLAVCRYAGLRNICISFDRRNADLTNSRKSGYIKNLICLNVYSGDLTIGGKSRYQYVGPGLPDRSANLTISGNPLGENASAEIDYYRSILASRR